MIISWNIALVLGERWESLIELRFLGFALEDLDFAPGTRSDQTGLFVSNLKKFLTNFRKTAS